MNTKNNPIDLPDSTARRLFQEAEDNLLSANEDYARDLRRLGRIVGEFAVGFSDLRDLGPAVTVFGSARTPADHPMYAKSRQIGHLLAAEGYAVITGGGPGIMEAANRGAAEAGGTSVGLGIELPMEQGLNEWVNLGINFRYFFTRKVMLVKYAQAFVMAPGGFGTLDEWAEAATLLQTGKIANFPIIMFGVDYWGGLIEWLRQSALAAGNISPRDMDAFHLTDDPAEVVSIIRAARPPR